MKKEININSLNLQYNKKNQVVFLDRIHSKAYVIDNDNFRKYLMYYNRNFVSITIFMLISLYDPYIGFFASLVFLNIMFFMFYYLKKNTMEITDGSKLLNRTQLKIASTRRRKMLLKGIFFVVFSSIILFSLYNGGADNFESTIIALYVMAIYGMFRGLYELYAFMISTIFY